VCIPREALLSGLVSRVRADGYLVTSRDVTSLRSAGLEAKAIAAAFAEGEGPAFAHARAVVAEVLAGA
jgi:hypothetical protein